MSLASTKITNIHLLDKLYLVGPPGIGKTEIIKQKSEEEARLKGKKFVDLREAPDSELNAIFNDPSKYYVYYRIIATHIFPEDLGIPRERSDYIEFLPPKVLKVLSLPDIEGILFIDELSNVQRDDQLSMLYSIIQEKEASWLLKISPNVKIVCAGNPSDWSEIVRVLPKPLRSRLTIVRVGPPDIDEWIKYMNNKYGDNWEKLIGAYLKLFPDDFVRFPESDDENYPCPRNWTELSVLLYQFKNNSDDKFKEELIIGRLGQKIGEKLIAFLNTNIDVVRLVNMVTSNPETFRSLNITEKVFVLHYISHHITREHEKYEALIYYLLEKDEEMLILLLLFMDTAKRRLVITKLEDVGAKIIEKLSSIFG